MTEILQLFYQNFWPTVLFLFFFGGSIGGSIKWLVERANEHSEKMAEKHNETLRLQLQLEQARNARSGGHVVRDPMPKEASWNEQAEDVYQTGYQPQMPAEDGMKM